MALAQCIEVCDFRSHGDFLHQTAFHRFLSMLNSKTIITTEIQFPDKITKPHRCNCLVDIMLCNLLTMGGFLWFVALLTCTGVVESRSSRRRSSRRSEPEEAGEKKAKNNRYVHKQNDFDMGGFLKFAKTTVGLYKSKNLKPSVKFSPQNENNYNSRAESCFHCLSINGSEPTCESGALVDSSKSCSPTSTKPYCSIEYGITGDNLKYVRRSCDAKVCQSCDEEGTMSECYPIQCQMCDWNNCNEGTVTKVFDDGWVGCRRDEEPSGITLFSKSETCASCSNLSNTLLVMMLCLITLFTLDCSWIRSLESSLFHPPRK